MQTDLAAWADQRAFDEAIVELPFYDEKSCLLLLNYFLLRIALDLDYYAAHDDSLSSFIHFLHWLGGGWINSPENPQIDIKRNWRLFRKELPAVLAFLDYVEARGVKDGFIEVVRDTWTTYA